MLLCENPHVVFIPTVVNINLAQNLMKLKLKDSIFEKVSF